jgi:WD40 repeat protein
MIINKPKYLVLGISFALFAAGFLLGRFLPLHHEEKELSEDYSDFSDTGWDEPFVEFSRDSTYKLVCDSMVHVWNKKTGVLLKEFWFTDSDTVFTGNIEYMAIHPSGKFMAMLDEDFSLTAWDLEKGLCVYSGSTYPLDQYQCIEFSDDGRYLLMVDYEDSMVDIYRWPGLEHLTTGELGTYRNDFNWKYLNGKVLFDYEIGDSIYRIIFPENEKADSLIFSAPVNVGRIVRKEDGTDWLI